MSAEAEDVVEAAGARPALLAREHFRGSLRIYGWAGAGLAIYVATVWGLAWTLGVGYKVSLGNYLTLALYIYLICLVLGLLGRLAWIMLVVRPRRLFRHIADDCAGNLFAPERIALALPVLLGMPVAMSVYSSLKRMIPDLVPYRFDETFWRLDHWLHFGHDPWRLLQPLLGTPSVTATISLLYHQTWLSLMILIWIWQACSLSRPRLRLQFLIAYLLVWVLLGNFGAVMLSSAGPPYYAEVTGLASPYAELFDYLKHADASHDVWSVKLQRLLWASHLSGGHGVGTGISAMPSVHVATTTLFTLLALSYGSVIGAVFVVYLAIIVVGSIHLGWHYAVDSYLSILLTVALWRGIGALLRRRLRFESDGERH
jgi:PAP2 superfamily